MARRDRDPVVPPSSARPADERTDDWPAQAADAIERLVGTVRDKTTGPAITVVRGIVYGTLALLVGTMVAVLLAVAAVRLLDAYLPSAVFGDEHVWAAHGIVGLLFAIVGMLLWSKRTAPDYA
jgi:hypothetical protein